MKKFIDIEKLKDMINSRAEMLLTGKEAFHYIAKWLDLLPTEDVIVPPCKVGDELWIVGKYQGVYSAKVRCFYFNEKCVEMIRTTKCDIPFEDFEKIAFRTKEEAEQHYKYC